MSALALPTTPSNLKLPPSVWHKIVDADVYGICDRIREVSASLFIVLLENDPVHNFAIMERCEDGAERLVFKVVELDGRVVQKLEHLQAIPLKERFEQIERENHRFEEQERERQVDDLYERVGAPMWRDLEQCGFIQRPVSYPKRGVKPSTT